MITKINYLSQLKRVLHLVLVYVVVAIMSLIAMVIYENLSWSLIHNFIESVLFSFLIILFILCFKNSRFKLFTYYLLFSAFVFFTYLEIVYFLIYGTYFSPSSIFLFFDSNPQEAIEFLTFYFSTPLLTFTLITLVVYVMCL